MTQTSFLDTLDRPPSIASSPTSIAAAEAIEPVAGTLRGKVLAWLREHGPATDEEMQAGIPMKPSTQRPRRIELVAAKLVVDSGTMRKGESGRDAVVWKATNQLKTDC